MTPSTSSGFSLIYFDIYWGILSCFYHYCSLVPHVFLVLRFHLIKKTKKINPAMSPSILRRPKIQEKIRRWFWSTSVSGHGNRAKWNLRRSAIHPDGDLVCGESLSKQIWGLWFSPEEGWFKVWVRAQDLGSTADTLVSIKSGSQTAFLHSLENPLIQYSLSPKEGMTISQVFKSNTMVLVTTTGKHVLTGEASSEYSTESEDFNDGIAGSICRIWRQSLGILIVRRFTGSLNLRRWARFDDKIDANHGSPIDAMIYLYPPDAWRSGYQLRLSKSALMPINRSISDIFYWWVRGGFRSKYRFGQWFLLVCSRYRCRNRRRVIILT